MSRRFRWLSFHVLCLALLGGCQSDPARKPVGKAFPAFAYPSPGSTSLVTSSGLRGGPALVVFWATWCAPCQEEVGELRQVLAKFGPKGLHIVGLSVDETPAAVPLLVAKLDIPYPVATGALPLFDSLKLESLPQSFLLDGQGKVVESFTGAVPAQAFEQAIEKLLASK